MTQEVDLSFLEADINAKNQAVVNNLITVIQRFRSHVDTYLRTREGLTRAISDLGSAVDVAIHAFPAHINDLTSLQVNELRAVASVSEYIRELIDQLESRMMQDA